MIHFKELSQNTFLSDFWQKKPLVIRNALPGFINPLSPDELAGLALEDDVESRIVIETPHAAVPWHLKRGPFTESDFASLPETHWTLLVQGVERLIPEVYALLHHFDGIPSWRFDDVMISYAPLHGSVGPHYDNYDVFLYQAKGSRKWLLTTKNCHENNFIKNLELRIMNEFCIEEEYILEEGDMLYLPAHVGHHGISQSEACMTYSFGYRSYPGQELWDSLGDYLSEHDLFKTLYRDPDWSQLQNPSELTEPVWKNAQKLLMELIQNEAIIKSWFGQFATRSAHPPEPLDIDATPDMSCFLNELKQATILEINPSCRIAWQQNDGYCFFINGFNWDIHDVSHDLLHLLASKRHIPVADLLPFLLIEANQKILFEFWKLQWVNIDNL